MKDVVVVGGLGEVGSAIAEIEEEAGNDVFIIDKERDRITNCGIMHVCIPYSESFFAHVVKYIEVYDPDLVIIHSTVPVGTTGQLCEKVGDFVVHSPIRGVHPHLAESIKTFVKYVGGEKTVADNAIEHFGSIGVNAKYLNSSETTELAKLLSTSYYGWNIAFADIAYKECEKYGVNFEDAYAEWNVSYNNGYELMNKPNVIRPILYPPKGVIGGHCIVPNLDLLGNKILNDVIKNVK